ncbi:MAG: sensor histidine kinase [Gorillibacterium sp.]|nr:sensor histidine kinase [Gorillibacterium sp.]
MRLAKRKYRISIGWKLTLTYLLLVSAPVLTIGTFAYLLSLHSATERTKTSIDSSMRQIHDNIDLKLAEIKRVGDQLYFDMPLQRVFRTQYTEVFDVYEMTEKTLKPSFNYALKLSGSTLLLTIYSKNMTIPELNPHLLDAPLQNQFGSNYALVNLRNKNSELFSIDRIPLYELVWTQVDNDKQLGNISLLRRMNDIEQGFTDIGLLRVIVKEKELFAPLSNQLLGAGARLFIVTNGNEVLYGERSGITEEEILHGSGKYIRTSLPVLSLKGELVALIPIKELHRDARNVWKLTVIVCLTSFLLLTVISILFSGYFSRRVNKIRFALDVFRVGEFHKRIHFSGKDEFNDIADSFNHMASTVDGLIHEVYVAQLKKKESELEALQAQINPHFLYNTLSSISQLAKMGENEKLHDMVFGLARYYRLTLNDGKSMISVKDELDQAETYLEIQRVKYGNRIKLYWDIDEAVYSCRTIKLLLQPFLENILKHAFYGESIGIRVVAVLSGEDLCFKIIDNGVGMDREVLESLFTGERETGGYGIRNVHQRIQLQYGDSYGVQMLSRKGMGTGVLIRIPSQRIPMEANLRSNR